ncbi:hypothetical protein ACFYY8_24695 [Streptosporangium sp. NPDC001559]|uniref:hypothetical protein n=1 Tax=Streptosporangium sp. NPDC001559 TaxID=3366187 RepID=UPI0036E6328E
MKSRKRAAALSTATFLSVGLLLTTAAPAHAIPDTCTMDLRGGYGASTCTTGTGEQRLSIAYIDRMNQRQLVVGNWAPVGGTSSVSFNGSIHLWWVDKRG